MAGEGGLLVGYGGCGRPGLGLGCAESLPGVPRLYEDSRVLQDMKTFIVYQKHLEVSRQRFWWTSGRFVVFQRMKKI